MSDERDEIIRLAAAVRVAQRQYFRDRNRDTLNVARRLERQMDEALAKHNAGAGQPSLFGEDAR